MTRSLIFSDISFDPQGKVAVLGLLFAQEISGQLSQSGPIKTRIIHETTCTKAELESVIWGMEIALEGSSNEGIEIYTDSKTVIDLLGRRAKLEAREFKSRKTGAALNLSEGYKTFFSLYDQLLPELTHLPGHVPKKAQNDYNRLFASVDQATRSMMRSVRAT